MELLRNKIFYLLTGACLIILSVSLYYYNYFSGWKITITGLHSLSQPEIKGYVQYYINENPDNISSNEIKNILKFHPRIKSADVKIHLKHIRITITEKADGYLAHNNHYISEVSSNGQVLQEMIIEKNHLSEDFPIFYLTVENDNEISTIKRDIIRLWETTKQSHAFIWERLSEIVLKKDEMDNPQIDFFHSHLPVKITMFNKFDSNAFRKLWAVLSLVESENYTKKTNVRIYQDHGVLE